jgi:hypothetical protein
VWKWATPGNSSGREEYLPMTPPPYPRTPTMPYLPQFIVSHLVRRGRALDFLDKTWPRTLFQFVHKWRVILLHAVLLLLVLLTFRAKEIGYKPNIPITIGSNKKI